MLGILDQFTALPYFGTSPMGSAIFPLFERENLSLRAAHCFFRKSWFSLQRGTQITERVVLGCPGVTLGASGAARAARAAGSAPTQAQRRSSENPGYRVCRTVHRRTSRTPVFCCATPSAPRSSPARTSLATEVVRHRGSATSTNAVPRLHESERRRRAASSRRPRSRYAR